jgi:hypothetical protein
MYAQYLRLNVRVTASNRAVIRAAFRLLSRKGRTSSNAKCTPRLATLHASVSRERPAASPILSPVMLNTAPSSRAQD